MSDDRPGRGSDQFIVRFPNGMRDEIRRLAQEDRMSMNAKVVQLLEFAVQNSGLDLDAIFRAMADQRLDVLRMKNQDENSQKRLLTDADLQAIRKIVQETISKATDC